MQGGRRAGRTRNPGGESGSVRTVERAVLLLNTLARHRGLTLTEVARHAELSASTTYRLLETLRHARFAELDADTGRWTVGLGAYQVGSAFVSGNSLLSACRPETDRLVADFSETVNVAVLDGAEVVYVHQSEGRHLVRMFTQLGARAPVHCTGAGKALVAWRDEADLRRLLGEGPYPAYTPTTITSFGTLLAELAGVRRDGYALDNEEREPGVRCIAAPVRNAAGQVIAALSLSAPTTRLSGERAQQYALRLRQAAGNVTQRLGGQDIPEPKTAVP